MKIALTVRENSPASPLDNHFGRCAFICVADTDSGEKEFIDNSESLSASHGAGINTAQTISESGAKVVITGSLGPKASRALEASGIAAYSCSAESIDEALKLFAEDKLEKIL